MPKLRTDGDDIYYATPKSYGSGCFPHYYDDIIKKFIIIMKKYIKSEVVDNILENVIDLIDRGDINDENEGVEYVKERCMKYGVDKLINFDILLEVLNEEFEEGFSERWEEVVY